MRHFLFTINVCLGGVFRENSHPFSQSSPLLGRSQVLFGNEESTRWSGLGAGHELRLQYDPGGGHTLWGWHT